MPNVSGIYIVVAQRLIILHNTKAETWQSEPNHMREALIYTIRKKLRHRRRPKHKFNKCYLASPLRLCVSER